jgi:hypothetical protein
MDNKGRGDRTNQPGGNYMPLGIGYLGKICLLWAMPIVKFAFPTYVFQENICLSRDCLSNLLGRLFLYLLDLFP